VDEAAVAALLAEIAHARARPLAIGDGAIDDALGHEPCAPHFFPFVIAAETRGAACAALARVSSTPAIQSESV
jgi:hypothetical protein